MMSILTRNEAMAIQAVTNAAFSVSVYAGKNYHHILSCMEAVGISFDKELATCGLKYLDKVWSNIPAGVIGIGHLLEDSMRRLESWRGSRDEIGTTSFKVDILTATLRMLLEGLREVDTFDQIDKCQLSWYRKMLDNVVDSLTKELYRDELCWFYAAVITEVQELGGRVKKLDGVA